MERILYILRGCPSSGKTTLAKTLEETLPNCVAIAADDFHYDNKGNYNWKPTNVGKSHDKCKEWVLLAMYSQCTNIIVHNTSTSEKELKPYTDMAGQHGYKVVSLVVENRHGNKNDHNVPQDTVDKMEQRLRNSIKLQ